MTDPWMWLLQRLAVSPHKMRMESADQEHVALWKTRGILVPAQTAASAVCQGCGEYYGLIDYLPKPGGRQCPYLACPCCGPIEVACDDLRRWRVDTDAFLALLSSILPLKAVRQVVMPNQLWLFGRSTKPTRYVFYAEQIAGVAEAEIVRHLRGKRTSILLVPWQESVTPALLELPCLLLALNVFMHHGDQGPVADLEYWHAQLHSTAGKPPATKRIVRASRATNISKLTAEVKRHMETAKRLWWDTRQSKSGPRLLPCPSKAELGKRVGLKRYEVTRCFQDENARELRLYWKIARDSDEFIDWCEHGLTT